MFHNIDASAVVYGLIVVFLSTLVWVIAMAIKAPSYDPATVKQKADFDRHVATSVDIVDHTHR